MNVNGLFSVKCSNCGKQHDFTPEEVDFDEVSREEREMGQETGYRWEHEFECDACGNEIEIVYDVWEYPQGTFNHDEIEITGGTEVERFTYDF